MAITKAKIKNQNGTLSEWIPLGASADEVTVIITNYESQTNEPGSTTIMSLQDAIDQDKLKPPPLSWQIV